jgi:dihydrofolate reductase
MSRKIIATDYVSLDGVIEDPVGMEGSGLGDWTGPFERGPEGDAFKHRELAGSDALLFGRVTYQAFSAVWPSVKDEAGFADTINALPKYVVSSTLKTADWGRTTIIGANIVDEVSKLRNSPGKDILVYGSGRLVHLLAQHGLIDEYRLMVYPVVLGRGGRLFPEGSKANLSLVEARTFGSGIVLLRYETAP